ncbi:MAG: hypothetical protein ACK4IA_15755 [Paracoccus hibiscisoli]|uniref:hypothetical protein n=1 Tax=Paracoccus hibiscisoli TaxID=2023261 RepID=UPI0039190999
MPHRILIVEDEFWTARHLAMEARDRGAIVLGPISSIPQAMDMLASRRRPEAVILDVQLRAEVAYALADTLMQQEIPFVFVTGYEKEDLPERFADVPHFVKPFSGGECIDAAIALITSARR